MSKNNQLKIRADNKLIKDYYKKIEEYYGRDVTNETSIRKAFDNLLEGFAKKVGWIYDTEVTDKDTNKRPDGIFRDKDFTGLEWGWFEAKGDKLNDHPINLKDEANKKIALGYKTDNLLLWQPKRIIIYQYNKKQPVFDEIIESKSDKMVDALLVFFGYEPAHITDWIKAVDKFKENIPKLSETIFEKVSFAKKTNNTFSNKYKNFLELCQSSINPNISEVAIDEMLIQHMLTRQIFVKVFTISGFLKQNIIASQLESLRESLSSENIFQEEKFFKKIEFFYKAIVELSLKMDDFAEKQNFLNTVFERFFQGWAVKSADRLGIVYTPQEVVDFMVRSVDQILKSEFGREDGLGSKGVHIIDPFVGTGNFIMRVMKEIDKKNLPHKYSKELHCNEVQLMPYYIASMNIEHEYLEKMGPKKFKPFKGICFADTFQMYEDEAKQKEEKDKPKLIGHYINKENTDRVMNQRSKDIFVVISNPPYNAHQADENDNNKNRKYPELEKSIKETYSKDSKATNKNALSDPYVKAFKWASKRIGDEGIVAMITNNSFIDTYAFDGMRKHLGMDFNKVITLNLGGNIRKCEGGNTNIFGIRVGVAITFFIKKEATDKNYEILYYDMKSPTAEEKKEWLTDHKASDLDWQTITPNKNHLWLTEGIAEDFEEHPLMGDKHQKGKEDCDTIFNQFFIGLQTSRDQWVYDFNTESLIKKVKLHANTYNLEICAWDKSDRKQNIDEFVTYDDKLIKWSSSLKQYAKLGRKENFKSSNIRQSLYRPFLRKYVYISEIMVHRTSHFDEYFPTPESEKENRVIWLKVGSAWSMFGLMVNHIPDLMPQGGSQNFPFYTYNEDGTGRKENITDKTLKMYQEHYKNNSPPQPSPQRVEGVSDGSTPPETSSPPPSQGGGVRGGGSSSITKWDIFYYIYAMLHHPNYREDFKDNLKRSLPRIPFAPDFWKFADTGKKLAELHLNYETVKQYNLGQKKYAENYFQEPDYKISKMKLSKDKKELVYNNDITLKGIPAEVFDYKLGNRSALEWIIDQYRVKTDKRSGITQDPNNFDGNEKYIFELIGKIVTVSLETVKLVKELSELNYK